MNIDELDAETLKRIGIKKPRQQKFSAEQERQYAIKCLATLSQINQDQRRRVLTRALKMNSV